MLQTMQSGRALRGAGQFDDEGPLGRAPPRVAIDLPSLPGGTGSPVMLLEDHGVVGIKTTAYLPGPSSPSEPFSLILPIASVLADLRHRLETRKIRGSARRQVRALLREAGGSPARP